MKAMYTAEATATGGRNGHVKSDNGVLDIQVRAPKAMGGANDDYTNPEQLFAAGYAACFDSALNHTIRQEKVKTGETTLDRFMYFIFFILKSKGKKCETNLDHV